KKTFLLIHALSAANKDDKAALKKLLESNDEDKIARVLAVYKACGVDEWASKLKQLYYEKAINHLDEVAVMEKRKVALRELADYLMNRNE
ncbi:MAG: polyprenyl synthetase family protein, partial [Ginsengibacter sp.]